MTKLIQLTGLAVAMMVTGSLTAGELEIPAVPSIPGVVFGPTEDVVVPGTAVYVDEAPIPLFQRVKYVDLHEAHPCAVPKIICVNNPCLHKKFCNSCCEPQCVYIKICVPPCGCEVVRCRRHGDRLRYDYGKFAVDVRIKKGFIVVDYQD